MRAFHLYTLLNTQLLIQHHPGTAGARNHFLGGGCPICYFPFYLLSHRENDAQYLVESSVSCLTGLPFSIAKHHQIAWVFL
jgi:hypothetical protein